MEVGAADVGPAGRILGDGFAQPLELAAAHLFDIGAVGPSGRRPVKEDRHAEASPDFLSCLAGEQRALLQFDAGDGHEGDYVGRADAG